MKLPKDYFVVERIENFRYDPLNKELSFLVKWLGYPVSSNTYESLEGVKECVALEQYIADLKRSLEADIEINNERLLQGLWEEIARGLNKPKPEIMDLIQSFDDSELEVYQAVAPGIPHDSCFYRRYEDLLFKNQFASLVKSQKQSLQRFLVKIRGKDYITVKVTNDVDFLTPASFNYIKKNIVSTDAANIQKSRTLLVDSIRAAAKEELIMKGQVPLEIYRTKDCGWGVKALTNVRKGRSIIECCGDVLTESEASARTDKSYFFPSLRQDGTSYVIDSCFNGNLSRFINHSCSPNAEFSDASLGQTLCLVIVASRDINKGEEITVSYTSNSDLPFQCQCGEENCSK